MRYCSYSSSMKGAFAPNRYELSRNSRITLAICLPHGKRGQSNFPVTRCSAFAERKCYRKIALTPFSSLVEGLDVALGRPLVKLPRPADLVFRVGDHLL